jgi:hypothetical protein
VLIVKNRRYAPAGRLFCAVYGRAQCITTTRFDGHHPTDKIQRIYGPPGGPEIRPAANLGPGTRPEPAPTTHGGYGRNTTGGWLADDPRVVPPRPRAFGGGGAGFGVQEPAVNSSGGARARANGDPAHRAGERSLLQLPSVGCKLRRKESPSWFKIIASCSNICWLLHIRDRPLWV